ncbi:FAD binding domain-containing protein [Cupriavidus sp. SIMBA_020]|uniref:FAD binding domain-containing protein n=1 Tax=Cupriavidus sp. SIMBA_020 TaxID=3085766 RepID=UPI00397A42AF
MHPTSTPRAVIIGGSLGGLFTALCLRATGWHVDVFERSPQALDSRGGGLVLQPDVADALAFAGAPLPEDFGVPSGGRIFVTRSGDVRRVYMPQTQIAWNGLYGHMRQALGPRAVHAGETFLALRQHGARVTACFASGRTETADLLVAADGPLSTVRAQLLPGAAPAYAGYAAWRGVLPESALPDATRQLLHNTFAFEEGHGHQLLTYLIPGENGETAPGQRRQNWVWYRPLPGGPARDAALRDRVGHQHLHSLPPGVMRDGEIDGLRHAARRDLAPDLATLVTGTPDPFLQLIHDYEAPRMVFGRVVLTGDAAFVARPHTGAGAGKAAGNAVALGRALHANRGGIDAALSLWERTQLPAGAQLVRWGMALGTRIMGRHDAA